MTLILSMEKNGLIVKLEQDLASKAKSGRQVNHYHISVDGVLLKEPPKESMEEGLERFHEVCREEFGISLK